MDKYFPPETKTETVAKPFFGDLLSRGAPNRPQETIGKREAPYDIDDLQREMERKHAETGRAPDGSMLGLDLARMNRAIERENEISHAGEPEEASVAAEQREQSEAREAARRPQEAAEQAQAAVVIAAQKGELPLAQEQKLQVAQPELGMKLGGYLEEKRSFGAKLKDKALGVLKNPATTVGFFAGAAFKGAVRSAVKRSFDLGTAGSGAVAGAVAGAAWEGGRAYLKERERIIKDIAPEQLEGLKGFAKFKKVLFLRRELESKVGFNDEGLKNQELLTKLKNGKVDKKAIAKAAMRGAFVGGVGGAAGGFLAESLGFGATTVEAASSAKEHAASHAVGEVVKWAPPGDYQVQPGDTSIWSITKHYLESHGVANPSESQVLEAAKHVAEESKVGVEAWGIEGDVADTAIQPGFTLHLGALHDQIEAWGGTPDIRPGLPEMVSPGAAVPELNMEPEAGGVLSDRLTTSLYVIGGGASALGVGVIAVRRGRQRKAQQKKAEPIPEPDAIGEDWQPSETPQVNEQLGQPVPIGEVQLGLNRRSAEGRAAKKARGAAYALRNAQASEAQEVAEPDSLGEDWEKQQPAAEAGAAEDLEPEEPNWEVLANTPEAKRDIENRERYKRLHRDMIEMIAIVAREQQRLEDLRGRYPGEIERGLAEHGSAMNRLAERLTGLEETVTGAGNQSFPLLRRRFTEEANVVWAGMGKIDQLAHSLKLEMAESPSPTSPEEASKRFAVRGEKAKQFASAFAQAARGDRQPTEAEVPSVVLEGPLEVEAARLERAAEAVQQARAVMGSESIPLGERVSRARRLLAEALESHTQIDEEAATALLSENTAAAGRRRYLDRALPEAEERLAELEAEAEALRANEARDRADRESEKRWEVLERELRGVEDKVDGIANLLARDEQPQPVNYRARFQAAELALEQFIASGAQADGFEKRFSRRLMQLRDSLDVQYRLVSAYFRGDLERAGAESVPPPLSGFVEQPPTIAAGNRPGFSYVEPNPLVLRGVRTGAALPGLGGADVTEPPFAGFVTAGEQRSAGNVPVRIRGAEPKDFPRQPAFAGTLGNRTELEPSIPYSVAKEAGIVRQEGELAESIIEAGEDSGQRAERIKPELEALRLEASTYKVKPDLWSEVMRNEGGQLNRALPRGLAQTVRLNLRRFLEPAMVENPNEQFLTDALRVIMNEEARLIRSSEPDRLAKEQALKSATDKIRKLIGARKGAQKIMNNFLAEELVA